MLPLVNLDVHSIFIHNLNYTCWGSFLIHLFSHITQLKRLTSVLQCIKTNTQRDLRTEVWKKGCKKNSPGLRKPSRNVHIKLLFADLLLISFLTLTIFLMIYRF